MADKLNLGEDFSLPLDAITQTQVVYGNKGMGKTNFAVVLMEEFYRVGARFSMLDPVGVSWGIKYGADRRTAGLGVLLLGGPHGDIPIEPTAGAVVADLVVDEAISTVVDISRRRDGRMWSVGEKTRFVAEYCTRLYERQGERRAPIHQLIDEAGRFVPQVIPHGAIEIAKCVGAIEQLTELGRNVGVGVTLITQRSARMNKSVSELAESMVAFRSVGPRSVAAILDWLGDHVESSRHKDILGQLRSLPVGHALVVSPGWLEFEGVVHIRARRTFDSSATPKAGKKVRSPGRAAKVDLASYEKRMLETIEKAKAVDPTELKKRITELERQLRARPVQIEPKVERVVERVEIPVFSDGELSRLEAAAASLLAAGKQVADVGQEIGKTLRLAAAARVPAPTRREMAFVQARPVVIPRTHHSEPTARVPDPSVPLSKAERRILSVLAQYPQGRTQTQVALLASYSSSGGGFLNAVGSLRSKSFIEGSKECLLITSDGLAAIEGAWESLPPPGPELVDHWLRSSLFGKAERLVLQTLAEVYPSTLSKEEIADRTGYVASGGGFLNALGKLRTLELVKGSQALSASEDLFGG